MDQDGTEAALFSNRAACHLQLGQPQAALADADQAIHLQPEWHKPHYRRGCALEAQGELQEALAAFVKAQELGPDSAELRARIKQLRRSIQAHAQAQEQEELDSRRNRRAPSGSGFHSGGRQRHPDSTGGGGSRGGVINMRVMDRAPSQPGGPDSWAEGLSPAQQREWLADCYRMRVDDEMHWCGRLRGLYLPEPSGEAVAEDFLVFCKLAVSTGVVPAQGWSWPAFLRHAAGLLPYAFDKGDAKEKWGGENVFHVMFGGRSLRATAEQVVGWSAVSGFRDSGEGVEERHLQEAVGGRIRSLLAAAAAGAGAGAEEATGGAGGDVFDDVGGAAAWAKLLAELGPAVARAGHWG